MSTAFLVIQFHYIVCLASQWPSFYQGTIKNHVMTKMQKEATCDNSRCLFSNWVLALLKHELGDIVIFCKGVEDAKNEYKIQPLDYMHIRIKKCKRWIHQCKSLEPKRATFCNCLSSLLMNGSREESRCLTTGGRKKRTVTCRISKF